MDFLNDLSYVCRSEEGLPDDVLRDGKRAAKRYLPFSEGPRSCAGMSLAKVNMTATLASLLGNFTFQLADEVEPPKPPLRKQFGRKGFTRTRRCRDKP
jgi:cytochrome P450